MAWQPHYVNYGIDEEMYFGANPEQQTQYDEMVKKSPMMTPFGGISVTQHQNTGDNPNLPTKIAGGTVTGNVDVTYPSTQSQGGSGSGSTSTQGWGGFWGSGGTTEGLLTKPGAGEVRGVELANKYAPGANPYAPRVQQIVDDLPNQGRGQNAYYDLQDYYGRPVPYEPEIMDLITALSGRTASDETWDLARHNLSGPGAAETWWDSARSEYGSPWASEQQYVRSADEFNRPGEFEQRWEGLFDRLGKPSGLQTRAATIDADLDKIQAAEEAYRAGKGALSRAGYAEKLADSWDPNRLSYSEDLYTGDNGLRKMFKDLGERSRRELENQLGASGSFNSGAAIAGVNDLSQKLFEAEVRKNIELANQADTQRMAYAGEGRQLMSAADQGLRGRYSTLGTLGSQADQSAEARARGRMDLGRELSRDEQDRISAQGDLASRAQNARLGRLRDAMDLAGKSDSVRERRLAGGQAGSAAADTGLRSRLSTLGSIGGTRDTENRLRISARADLFDNLRAKQEEWRKKAAEAAARGDQEGISYARDILGQIDKALGIDSAWDNMGMGYAKDVQSLFEGRERGNMRDIEGIASSYMAALTGMNAGQRKEQLETDLAIANGILANGNASAQEKERAAANIQTILQTASQLGITIGGMQYMKGSGTSTTPDTSPAGSSYQTYEA